MKKNDKYKKRTMRRNTNIYDNQDIQKKKRTRIRTGGGGEARYITQNGDLSFDFEINFF